MYDKSLSGCAVRVICKLLPEIVQCLVRKRTLETKPGVTIRSIRAVLEVIS